MQAEMVHTGRKGQLVSRLKSIREFNILIAFVLLCVFLAIGSPQFLTSSNIFGVMRAFSLTAIMAVGMTLVIMTGGIDISVGSLLGLSALLAGVTLNAGWTSWAAVAAGILAATAFGLFNGLLVTRLQMPPFIVTIGTMSIGRGIIYVVTRGYPISVPIDNQDFAVLGQGYVGPVPVPVVIMLVVALIGHVLLTQTRFGRYTAAIGGNELATRLSGVNVDRVKLLVYTLSGFFSGIAGIVLLARLVSVQPSAGLGYEMPVIAACVIGGASLAGGEGSIVGSLLGAALIGVLENGMVLLGINTYAQQAVTGAVILLAVGLDMWRKRR